MRSALLFILGGWVEAERFRFRDGQFSGNKGLAYLHHLACVCWSVCARAPGVLITVEKVHNTPYD